MPRTGGEQTRKKILDTAEELFAQKGFDGTSVDRIASHAGVNKALIYYHFKNKNDLIVSLFESIVDDLDEHLTQELALPPTGGVIPPEMVREKVRREIEFLEGRRRIIALALAEALRQKGLGHALFQCAEMVMEHELRQPQLKAAAPDSAVGQTAQGTRAFEFFTGFIPAVTFVAMRDQWCEYFGCDRDRLLDDFLDAFMRTHMAAHHNPNG